MIRYDKEIRECLEKLKLIKPVDTIDEYMDLREAGMDSLMFIALITDIEDLFSIEFPLEALVMDRASTIGNLDEIITKCRE